MTGGAAASSWTRLAGTGNMRAFLAAAVLVVGISVALAVYGLSAGDEAGAQGSGSPTEEQRDPDNYLLRCLDAADGDQDLVQFCSRLVPS